jgi:hypothetical protein
MGLMRDRSAIDRHDRLFHEEGCGGLSPRFPLGFLSVGESPGGHVIFHHGALLELMPDGVHVVWTGHFEKFLEVIGQLSCLTLEIVLGGSNVFLIRAVSFLLVIVIITTSSNCDPLEAPLLPLLSPLALLLAPLPAALSGATWLLHGGHFPIALDKNNPGHLFFVELGKRERRLVKI